MTEAKVLKFDEDERSPEEVFQAAMKHDPEDLIIAYRSEDGTHGWEGTLMDADSAIGLLEYTKAWLIDDTKGSRVD